MRMRDFTAFEHHVSGSQTPPLVPWCRGFPLRPIDVLVVFSLLSVLAGVAFRLCGRPEAQAEPNERCLRHAFSCCGSQMHEF